LAGTRGTATRTGAGDALIGTSGWHYRHWLGTYYPDDLSTTEMLAYYAERFCTVEVNYTFYRLPTTDAVAAWHDAVGDGFTFAVKASRYLTHLKKLKDPEQPIAMLFERLAPLRDKLGPILFQLPPRWHRNTERLAGLLSALPPGRRYAFEFRDPTWFVPEVYDRLSEHGAALCICDRFGERSPLEVTADFVYLRMHGPSGGMVRPYRERELTAWSGAIGDWVARGLDAYVYFNNDPRGHAPRDAARLAEMVEAVRAERPAARSGAGR
jgi:uncharacterized protein YecE (DUF72 family)